MQSFNRSSKRSGSRRICIRQFQGDAILCAPVRGKSTDYRAISRFRKELWEKKEQSDIEENKPTAKSQKHYAKIRYGDGSAGFNRDSV